MSAGKREPPKPAQALVLLDARIPKHLKRIHAPQAWARDYRGEGVGLAIVDSGIDNREGAARRRLNAPPSNEPLIYNRTWEPNLDLYRGTRVKYGGVFTRESEGMPDKRKKKYSFFDEYGHGTKMAGIIAARPGFDGVMGIAPRARVYNYKITDDDGLIAPGSLTDAAHAILESRKRPGVRLVLFALDMRVYGSDHESADPKVRPSAAIVRRLRGSYDYTADLKASLNCLSKAGIVVVIAASDDPRGGRCLDGLTSFPGSYGLNNLLVVAAHDGAEVGSEKLIPYSNWGEDTVHLAACGRLVPSVAPTAPVTVFGTSVAAAIVAGAGALVAGANPDLSAAELREAILELSRPVPELAGKTITGGVLDLSLLPCRASFGTASS